ncbi:unnamed protein product [Calypogeia fissa]
MAEYIERFNPSPLRLYFQELSQVEAQINGNFSDLRAAKKWRFAGLGESQPTSLDSEASGTLVGNSSSAIYADYFSTTIRPRSNADHLPITRPSSKTYESYIALEIFLYEILEDFDAEGKDEVILQSDGGRLVSTAKGASEIISAEDFVREIEKGGEDGYFVSSKWLLSLAGLQRNSLMHFLRMAGYSEAYETATTNFFARITDYVECSITYNNPSSKIIKNSVVDESIGEVEPPNFTNDRLGIAGKSYQWQSFLATLKSKCHQSFSVSTRWLSDLAEYERKAFAQICLDAGYEEIFQTQTATWYERVAEQVLNPAGGQHSDDSTSSSNKNETTNDDTKKPGTAEIYMVDKDDPSGSFVGANMRETTWYRRIQDHDVVNSPIDAGEDDSSSSSNGNNASGEVNNPGTSGGGGFISRLGNWFGQVLKVGDDGDTRHSNGVTNETETSPSQGARPKCCPQRLRVTCCSDSTPPSPSRDLPPSKRSMRKELGDNEMERVAKISPEEACEQLSNLRVVTMPSHGAYEQIPTAIDRCFSIPTIAYFNSGAMMVPASLKASAQTSLSCCCVRIDHSHLQVRVKFSKMSGVVNSEDSDESSCVVLRSVWTNVYGCCFRNSEDPPEPIDLYRKDEASYNPGQRMAVEHTPNSSDGLVRVASSLQKLGCCDPGSVSLELQRDGKRRLKDGSMTRDQRVNGLDFHGSHPVTLEGNINFQPESLAFDIRHWLEIVYYKPRRPSPNAVACSGTRTSKVIDFNCSFEVKLDSTLVS